MYNNDYMYAIERSDEFLAHYGVRGMKWGVRRAAKLMTLNDKASQKKGQQQLSKQYAKASKKLAKLEKQASRAGRYGRRAALLGAGAAAAGAVAGFGPKNIAAKGAVTANRVLGGTAAQKIARLDAGQKVIRAMNGRTSIQGTVAGANRVLGGTAAQKIARLDAGKAAMNSVRSGAVGANKVLGGTAAQKIARLDTANNIAKKGVSNNTLARLGAGAIGAGLAAGAARNAYKAATAQKKAAKFKSEMNKAFAGTKYANGGKPRQGKKRRR